jgi:hypothetical protein
MILALARIVIYSFIILTYHCTVIMIVNYNCKTFIVLATENDYRLCLTRVSLNRLDEYKHSSLFHKSVSQ